MAGDGTPDGTKLSNQRPGEGQEGEALVHQGDGRDGRPRRLTARDEDEGADLRGAYVMRERQKHHSERGSVATWPESQLPSIKVLPWYVTANDDANAKSE